MRMSHSKIHIIGGGSSPIAKTRCSANGSMYMPCSIAGRESDIACTIAATVAGSSENHWRAQSSVMRPTSADGSRARSAASIVFSSYSCQNPAFRYSVIGPARHGPPSWVQVQTPSMFSFAARSCWRANWYSGPRSLGKAPKFSNSRRLWNSTIRRCSPCSSVTFSGSQL